MHRRTDKQQELESTFDTVVTLVELGQELIHHRVVSERYLSLPKHLIDSDDFLPLLQMILLIHDLLEITNGIACTAISGSQDVRLDFRCDPFAVLPQVPDHLDAYGKVLQ